MASISRGKFLKSLGSSASHLVLGAGFSVAAKTLGRHCTPPTGISSVGETLPSRPPFIRHGSRTERRIALTFDDGPTPEATEHVLDELQKRSLPATFFLIGGNIASAPELARRMVSEGHEIGNHTYTHPRLTSLSDAQVDEELQKTQEAIFDAAGILPACFRPPYGQFRANQTAIAHRKKLIPILWSIDSKDWEDQNDGRVVENVLKQTTSGDFILCHDHLPLWGKALGSLLDGLQQRNFALARVSDFTGSPSLL